MKTHLQSRALTWVAVALWLAGWAYFGVPRQFASDAVMRRIEWIPELHKPPDMLFNFGYYVLLGVLARRLSTDPKLTIGLAAALSLLTEVLQAYSTTRHPSATDVVVNIAGTVAGIWLLRWWTRRPMF